MNNLLQVFRTLLIVSLVLGLAGGVLDFVATSLVPEALGKAYEEYQPFGEDQWVVIGIVALVVLITSLVGLIGLLLLKRWARSLSLWITIVSLAGTALMGATLYSGPASALLDASWMLWGAALAMAYFSDLKVHFEPARARAATVG